MEISSEFIVRGGVIEMVGISGKRDRQIMIIKDKFGNDVVVFGNWENWEDYYLRYIRVGLSPEYQWQWKQNYPNLIVEDILKMWDRLSKKDEEFKRDWLYADLLKRGINKWLFVRYMLIRYKKLVAEWRNEYYEKWREQREKMVNMEWSDIGSIAKEHYQLGYLRGKFEAYRIVRRDLKTLCSMPRFVIWNGSRPGLLVDKKITQGKLRLIEELYNVRFEK